MQTRTKQLALTTLMLLGFAANAHSSEVSISSRIVGGQETDINAVPSTVALIDNGTLSRTGSYFQSQFCGGTVIASRWVLTAAHCIVGTDGSVTPGSNVSILMGSTDLNNPVHQPVGVTQIVPHESYRASGHAYDIALLQLEYDALVPSAPIDQQAVLVNQMAFIAGWGALQAGDNGQQQTFPDKLRGAYVRMVPGVECAQRFISYYGQVDDSQLCAGSVQGQVDTCQGDSGGPLYRVSETSSRPVSVAGITSWGIGCGSASTPGVYTQVTAYANWIQARTGGAATVATVATGTTVPVNDAPPPPVVNQPVLAPTPQQLPASTSSPQNALTAAGAGIYLFPILGLLALIRRFFFLRTDVNTHSRTARTQPCGRIGHNHQNETRLKLGTDHATVIERYSIHTLVVLSAVVVLVLFIRPSPAANEPSSVNVALSEQPITQQRESVMLAAQALWHSEPVCTVLRTGYGMSRRAYFLETCAFVQASQNRILGENPSQITYLFLDRKLVQIAVDFDEIHNQHNFRAQALQQAKALQQNSTHTIRIDEDFRVTLSDTPTVNQIHLLRNTL